MANRKQLQFNKNVLKTILNKNLTESQAVKVLKGESEDVLHLIITSDADEHKFYLNDKPIGEQEFNRLSLLPQHINKQIRIFV